MDSVEIEDKSSKNISDKEPKTQIKKLKKKKKKVKIVKEKKCSGLKELLEQISEEKKVKIQKEKEKKDKNEIKLKIKIDKKEETLVSSGIPSPIENEDKNKDYSIKDQINIFNNSISGTTVATLSYEDSIDFQKFNYDKYSDGSIKCEYNDLKPSYLTKNFEILEENKDDLQLCKIRKYSSPICDYFDGFDKILREKTKGSIDLTNSSNFIRKEDFISSNNYMKKNHIFNNNMPNNLIFSDINNNINANNIYNDNIIKEINFDNNKIITNDNNNNENNLVIDNNYNNLKQIDTNDCNYMNIPYYQYIDYYNLMPEAIINSKFTLDNDMGNMDYYNAKKNRNKNKKHKKDKNKTKIKAKNNKDNSLILREGDWLCQFCSNLNFSFRAFCNRCKAPK